MIRLERQVRNQGLSILILFEIFWNSIKSLIKQWIQPKGNSVLSHEISASFSVCGRISSFKLSYKWTCDQTMIPSSPYNQSIRNEYAQCFGSKCLLSDFELIPCTGFWREGHATMEHLREGTLQTKRAPGRANEERLGSSPLRQKVRVGLSHRRVLGWLAKFLGRLDTVKF